MKVKKNYLKYIILAVVFMLYTFVFVEIAPAPPPPPPPPAGGPSSPAGGGLSHAIAITAVAIYGYTRFKK